ncbi:MAG: hypothetical protein QF828_12545 [Pseudomonadales bacterium]|jgi:hypothetical protein|nr:hypothetical protein [Pseudomonadales bacterium]MDP7359232.1 hypothetical protein [Pseudomonadales bacterium]HJN50168.1 hypothetical protein [Pseudomonadales bacterium]|tara:strand:- start:110 stop:352 length:243 start_codon:yes stop_codon:yes gene_type:complete
MMPGTEHERIRKAGFSPIDPVHHVMRIKPLFMSAAWVAATLVTAQQRSFQLRVNYSVFPPHIQWVTTFIFGHSNQATVAA